MQQTTQNNKALIPVPIQENTGYQGISLPEAVSLFRKLRKKVYSKRPILQDILQRSGSLSLYNYTKNHINIEISGNQTRKEQFITVLAQCVQDLLGSKVAESVSKQIRKYPYVITADHHGALGHPGFVTSNLLESMPYKELQDKDLQNVIVLSCSNVSFDNYSFPRGLRFHSYQNQKINESQIAFFGRTVDSRPVVNFRPYTYESIQSIKKTLGEELNEGHITLNLAEKLEQLINDLFLSPNVLSRHNFSDQVSIINYSLWKKFFGVNKPNLIYLEQEEIVNQLIILYHLYSDTVINKILFNKHYHKSILKHFDGIMGAFNSQDNTGTFLFWALPKGQKYRVQLKKQGKFLVSPDQTYKLELTSASIHNAILNKEIIPSTLLSFIILSFYHGLRLLGGFNQTTYLTQMKEGYIAMQKELGDIKNSEDCINMPTTDMVFTRSLAYIHNNNEAKIPVTGLDLILYGNKDTIPYMCNAAKQITLREAIYARLIPYLYRTYYPKDLHDLNLLAITEEDIEKSVGLDNKYYFLPIS